MIISDNQNTIYSLIREYHQKHYVEQVKKGLYVAVSMETGAPVASRFGLCERSGKGRRYFRTLSLSAWQMYVPKNYRRVGELEE